MTNRVPRGRWKPYPAYKPSGVEWLGEIPAHWEVRRLKNVTALNPETLAETTDPDYVLQYLDISNVDEVSGINPPEEMRFENAPSRARRNVRAGDTILSTVRTYLKAIAYFDAPPENLIVSTGFAVLHPKHQVLPQFLHVLVRCREFIEAVVAHSTGVGYPAINPTELSCLPVWLPPIDEQRAIAAFLDRETAQLDALIAKHERLIELLQEKRAALISHAVTQGLDPSAPMKDSGVPWLGKIPAHWEVIRVKRITATHKQGYYTEQSYVDDGVKLARITDIDDFAHVSFDDMPYVEITPKDETAFALKDGDFVFAPRLSHKTCRHPVLSF